MNEMSRLPAQPQPKLLDGVRHETPTRHHSPRTEDVSVTWVTRLIFFHGKRHPAEMGHVEVTQVLSPLAVDFRGSASTQDQALHPLLSLYREVLDQRPPWPDGSVPAKRPVRLPVVLARQKVRAVLSHLRGYPA